MATRKTSTSSTRKNTKAEASSADLKAASAAKPTPATAAAPDEEPKPKHKLVRDSFTIPKNEYALLDDLKQRATRLTRPAKKSEILRAGIGALNAMSDKAFVAALGSVPSLKTGRPKHAKLDADKTATRRVRPGAEAAVGLE